MGSNFNSPFNHSKYLLFINDHCFIEMMFLDFIEQQKHSKGSWKFEVETFTPKVKISNFSNIFS